MRKTLNRNVAQAKADFKGVKDAIFSQVGYDLTGVPTSEYGNKVDAACSEMYTTGKQDGVQEGYESGRSDGIDEGFAMGKSEGLLEGYENGKTDGIAEGVEQGIEQGRQDVISKSKYIEKTASGKGVFLTDVSEVAHKVKVKADTPTEVKDCGKNLFDVSKVTEKGSENAGYVVKNDDGSITVTSTNATPNVYIGNLSELAPNLRIGDRVVLSVDTDSTRKTAYLNNTKTTWAFGSLLEITEEHLSSRIAFYSSSANVASTFNKIQIEYDKATEYEPYKVQTITATPEGAEIPSICPAMTFLTDTEITVDYYSSYGMQTEYDRFWDGYQQNGSRTNYAYGFYGNSWNDTNFKPKYDIVAITMPQCFYSVKITNLVAKLEEQGIRFDTSGCTSLSYAFAHSSLTNLPKIDMSKCTNSDSMCVTCTSLTQCEGIVSTETTKFNNGTFQNCSSLEHCIFEGTIASDINLQWSKKLDLESLVSLFRCLKNFRENDPDNDHTKTITLSSESWALLDTYVYENGWSDYTNAQDVVSSVLGWNYA